MSQAFPTTRWSHLLADPAGGSQAARQALESLAQRYWRPIAAYARALRGGSDEDARDATQAFFLWMIESGFLSQADPARGRFRGLVKKSLANFLHDLERGQRTQKRGGGRPLISLDGRDAPEPPPDRARSPEEALDQQWRRELLTQAAEALENELCAKGKEVIYAVFRDYFLSDEEPDYEALVRRHGITRIDVSNHLMHAKRRYRAHLRAAVHETVQCDDDLRAELAWLFEGRSSA